MDLGLGVAQGGGCDLGGDWRLGLGSRSVVWRVVLGWCDERLGLWPSGVGNHDRYLGVPHDVVWNLFAQERHHRHAFSDEWEFGLATNIKCALFKNRRRLMFSRERRCWSSSLPGRSGIEVYEINHQRLLAHGNCYTPQSHPGSHAVEHQRRGLDDRESYNVGTAAIGGSSR